MNKHLCKSAFLAALPEILPCTPVVGLHIRKKNTLLSIIAGTVCCMVLVQAVF